MRVNRSLLLLAIVPMLVFSGCGKSDRVTVYPVRGTVTLEGKPMPGGGSIAFVPTKKQAGKTAGGEIRENGTYQLTTYAEGDGSMVGEFRVVIIQAVATEPQASQDGEKPPEGGGAVSPEDRIAAGYSDPVNSPLKATVEPKGSNEINFDLKRKLEPAEGAPPPGVAAILGGPNGRSRRGS